MSRVPPTLKKESQRGFVKERRGYDLFYFACVDINAGSEFCSWHGWEMFDRGRIGGESHLDLST